MWRWPKELYRTDGTKVLGYIAIALGAMQSMTLWFSPKGIQLIGAASMVVGALTVRRGFTNSKNIDADDQH